MRRLFEAAAYAPQAGTYWAETVPEPDWPQLAANEVAADTAVIGGGFTGLVAALRLAQAGAKVVLLEAEHPGWGASGRNGGFCCLGGSKATGRTIARRYGPAGLADWRAAEKTAIGTVADLVSRHRIDADIQSDGETLLAHSPRAWARMRASADAIATDYGVTPRLTERDALRQEGLAGPFFGALTTPLGFALNPRKYHSGLAAAAIAAGARLCARTRVLGLERRGAGWRLRMPQGVLNARQVILTTNGYSSDDLPDWLRARYLPAQSSVLVTRPLSHAEREAQGWTSAQMAYDSRRLLHYFRLLPDGRFLFGMRGGLSAREGARRAISRRIRADFATMFPAWRDVEITHEWSGLVCLMASLMPFVGPVPGNPGLFAGLGYHGNGVAMASHAGTALAELALGRSPDLPDALKTPPARFPLGRFRRALLRPAYAAAMVLDL